MAGVREGKGMKARRYVMMVDARLVRGEAEIRGSFQGCFVVAGVACFKLSLLTTEISC